MYALASKLLSIVTRIDDLFATMKLTCIDSNATDS